MEQRLSSGYYTLISFRTKLAGIVLFLVVPCLTEKNDESFSRSTVDIKCGQ